MQDMSVDCNSSSYFKFAIIASGFVLLYPIGIPLVFGVILYHNRVALSKDTSKDIHRDQVQEVVDMVVPGHTYTEETLDGLFKRIDKDGSQSISVAEFTEFALRSGICENDDSNIDNGDADAMELEGEPDGTSEQAWYIGDRSKFGFLVGSYDPHCFWFGIVDYSRKFVTRLENADVTMINTRLTRARLPLYPCSIGLVIQTEC